MRIIDIHTHVFPDAIAKKATESISGFYDMIRFPDRTGTVNELLQAQNEAGISLSCIHSVAVTPHSIPSINRFIADSVRAHPDRLRGFAAVHPDAEDLPGLVNEVYAAGLAGFKIHPDMQKFALDEPKTMKMFAAIEGKLPVIIHTGDKRFDFSHPIQMKKVLEAFPKLICVCAHLGGWSEWAEAAKTLSVFDNAYVDTSSSLYALNRKEAARIIRCYSRDRVLFGTDFPMWNPAEEMKRFLELGLNDDEQEKILHKNAEDLLSL